MTKEEYFKFHEAFTRSMYEITKAKNADYTGASSDPFANFSRVETLGICSTEQGFLTRMTDKLCRLASFAKQGTLQVKDESAQDTLKDLANYCILMSAYLESKRLPALPLTRPQWPNNDECSSCEGAGYTFDHKGDPQSCDPCFPKDKEEDFKP
jgi:hypothetical protein